MKINLIRYSFFPLCILILMVSGCAHHETKRSGGPFLLASSEPAETSDAVDDRFAEDDFDFLDEEDASEPGAILDPLAPWNRAMFHFNDKLYFWLLKPVTEVYKAVTPTPFRTGVMNFFQNLTTPVRFVNCILQGKSDAAGTELGRFMVNSTIGIFGILDLSNIEPNLKRPAEEDFGQTLGVYGLGDGIYIVWPLAGPSSFRDTFGIAGDWFLNPKNYIKPAEVSTGLSALDQVNSTSFRLGDYESLKSAALDPYTAIRNAYIQRRNAQIKE